MALNRHSSHYGGDYDSYGAGVYGSAPRSRRGSSVSFHPSASTGGLVSGGAGYHSGGSAYGGYGGKGVGSIKFRTRYSTSGMTLQEAVGGERPAGGDMYKWHELHADRNGEIYLRVSVSAFTVAGPAKGGY